MNRPGLLIRRFKVRFLAGALAKARPRPGFFVLAIDDCTRLAYVEVVCDEKAITAVGTCAARSRSSSSTASGSSG
jgi:hypothetical protein